MYRNQMASQHDFAMIPRPDVPRSTYMLQQARKTTFNGGDLIPIYCEEVLPGDHFQGELTTFCRFATPITAVLDNAKLETFFFFVPNRLGWEHWENFISGEDYTIPVNTVDQDIADVGTLYDQFGIPTKGQLTGASALTINALPLRAYYRIFNEWFRDQNLVTALTENIGDGPDATNYLIQKRAKKHDYFTSALPWPQKGTAVDIPLGTEAPVFVDSSVGTGNSVAVIVEGTTTHRQIVSNTAGLGTTWGAASAPGQTNTLFADLSNATAATINALRLAFQTQRMLEKDARGGARYIEQLQAHFGVRPPDFRLQRPEYIGGGKSMVNTTPIPQTSSTDVTTPQGNLAGYTTATGSGHRFRYAATEHGYIIGLANVQTDITYQQGLRRHWSRSTRYDFYFPSFAHLGEQTILRKEIYCKGDGNDLETFGYQERYAEYRYTPNEICGLFKSTAAGAIDQWHYSEEFGSEPQLNAAFIADPSEATLERSMAVGASANGQQILMDMLFRVRATRPMPTYSQPGLIDHF